MEMRLDCGIILPRWGKIPHLRDELYFYPQGVRDIRKR